MMTFAVRAGERLEHFFMANAETPEEAVLYAMGKRGLWADEYIVYDWDLNRYVVPRPKTVESDE